MSIPPPTRILTFLAIAAIVAGGVIALQRPAVDATTEVSGAEGRDPVTGQDPSIEFALEPRIHPSSRSSSNAKNANLAVAARLRTSIGLSGDADLVLRLLRSDQAPRQIDEFGIVLTKEEEFAMVSERNNWSLSEDQHIFIHNEDGYLSSSINAREWSSPDVTLVYKNGTHPSQRFLDLLRRYGKKTVTIEYATHSARELKIAAATLLKAVGKERRAERLLRDIWPGGEAWQNRDELIEPAPLVSELIVTPELADFTAQLHVPGEVVTVSYRTWKDDDGNHGWIGVWYDHLECELTPIPKPCAAIDLPQLEGFPKLQPMQVYR